MNRLAFYVLVLLLCAAAFALSFPQYKILKQKQLVLAEAREEERESIKQKDRAKRENRALQEGVKYMELKSRDLLDYFKPGETIFEVNREGRIKEEQ